MLNIWNFLVGNLSLRQIAITKAIIQQITDINLETGIYGSKSGVSCIIRDPILHPQQSLNCQK